MTILAADDVDTIFREIRRNRVVEAGIRAGLENGATIPTEIFLGAGFKQDEIDALPSGNRRWPLLEHELR